MYFQIVSTYSYHGYPKLNFIFGVLQAQKNHVLGNLTDALLKDDAIAHFQSQRLQSY